MFFDDSRPDRSKRARRYNREARTQALAHSPIPPAKPYELLTADELFTGGDRTFIFDVESYTNYFLIAFKCYTTGKVVCFESTQQGYFINGVFVTWEYWRDTLTFVLHRFRLIGFNSRVYDLPIILVALQGIGCWKLKEISDEIILQGLQAYEVERKYNARPVNVNHIDLIEVAPIQASLKIYAGRLHCKRMQDLPYPPDSYLTNDQVCNVRDYCVNDLDNTELLFNELHTQIVLRETLGYEYGQDLRSKSDAQIAEAVITSELQKIGALAKKPGVQVGSTFKYKVPAFMHFKTPELQRVLETVRNATFVVGNDGKADTPSEIEALHIRLGGCVYRMGNGGLHSSEKSKAYVATDTMLLIDRDVESYYPNIILTQGLYPEHLGPAFLEVFRKIVLRRAKAKRDGDKKTSDSLKITINGTFGKLGNMYSNMYSPDLLSQVTISGQLCLLMLIEAIELIGISVISANTDGIVIHCPVDRQEDLKAAIIAWEEQTGFLTEETRYKSLYSRDVNNYIAVKEDGACKTKGVYCERGSALNSVLSKNPEMLICSDAVQKFLAEGVPVAHTIEACRDIRRFVSVRTVKGGAEKGGVYLGKAIRWIYTQGETGEINYVLTGNKVPKSEGASPLMELPDNFPANIDVDRYINEATKILFEIGYYKKSETGSLFA